MIYKLQNIMLLMFSVSILISCGNEEEITPVRQDIKELVFASGELQWDDAYNLTAQTDGILMDANFDVGNQVIKGDSLAKVDNKNSKINTSTAVDQLAIAKLNLTSASPALLQLQENIDIAEKKYVQDEFQEQRYKELYDSESVAKLEYENMMLNAANSLANLNALKKQELILLQQAKVQQINAESQLKNNIVVQDYNNIIVTEDGTVIKKLKTNGDYVRKGEVIATIANHKKVEGVLSVDENNIDKVKLGQAVFIKLNTDKQTVYNGKVTEILSAFDEKTQSFICKVKFDDTMTSSLYGTQLEANILIGEKKDALLIPRIYVDYGNKVNVKGEKENVAIQTGIVSAEYVEVLGGIDENTIILPLKH